MSRSGETGILPQLGLDHTLELSFSDCATVESLGCGVDPHAEKIPSRGQAAGELANLVRDLRTRKEEAWRLRNRLGDSLSGLAELIDRSELFGQRRSIVLCKLDATLRALRAHNEALDIANKGRFRELQSIFNVIIAERNEIGTIEHSSSTRVESNPSQLETSPRGSSAEKPTVSILRLNAKDYQENQTIFETSSLSRTGDTCTFPSDWVSKKRTDKGSRKEGLAKDRGETQIVPDILLRATQKILHSEVNLR
jgi:hypothetical protein